MTNKRYLKLDTEYKLSEQLPDIDENKRHSLAKTNNHLIKIVPDILDGKIIQKPGLGISSDNDKFKIKENNSWLELHMNNKTMPYKLNVKKEDRTSFERQITTIIGRFQQQYTSCVPYTPFL